MLPEPWIDQLIARYRNRGVLVDTNLLLLDVIGRRDPRLILQHKRTAQFSVEDFVLLEALLAQFRTVATTPHILTEVSNLLGQAGNAIVPLLRDVLARRIEVLDERGCTAAAAATSTHFRRLGLTDAALFSVCEGSFVVLTPDAALAYALESRGVDVVNLTHLQSWA